MTAGALSRFENLGNGACFHPPLFRLVVTPPAPGAWNMAVDEAILEAHLAGRVPPTLRFYGWNPPALSLGYFQRFEQEVDEEACRRDGVDIVRRPTGGRAILHDQEVTYSVVIRAEWLPGGVRATYRTLSLGLLAGLRALGVPAQWAPAAPRHTGTAACFDSPSWYEIAVGGRKLVGSAQVRRGSGLLQHGTIPVQLGADRLFALLRCDPKRRLELVRMLQERATDLHTVLGRVPAINVIQEALAQGFAAALGIRLQVSGLTPEEQRRAAELVEQRYTSLSWTRHR